MKLADYLDREKLTQAQFAELVGSTQQSVARWSRGTVPHSDWLQKIIAVTKGAVSWEDFNPLDRRRDPVTTQSGEAAA